MFRGNLSISNCCRDKVTNLTKSPGREGGVRICVYVCVCVGGGGAMGGGGIGLKRLKQLNDR